jgi:hypothetical protein
MGVLDGSRVKSWISIKPFFVRNLPKDARGEFSKAVLSGAAIGILILVVILDIGILAWEKPEVINSLVGLSPVILCIIILTVIFSSMFAFIRFQYIKALKKGVNYSTFAP